MLVVSRIVFNRSTIVTLAVTMLLQFGQPLVAQTRFSGTTMGPIVYNVSIADQVDDVDALAAAIKGRLEQINSLMSTYIPDSEVSRLNRADADEWVEVDSLTLLVVKKSLQLSEATDGAFDITVGPAVQCWRFGVGKSNAESIPDAEQINELKKFVGFRFIETQDDPCAIRKKHAQTKIDLSAIAKGFAVDRVTELLNEKSYDNFMVEVGGEVFARGKAAADRQWRLGIELPVASKRSVSKVVLLKDRALATSGDYRNFRVVAGKKYSHTIDPVTCEPIQNDIASASVVADDCLTADALATAVMVAGSEKGMLICESLNTYCSIQQRTGEDDESFIVNSTNNFPFAPDAEIVAEAESDSIWPAFIGAIVIFALAITGMAVGAIFNNRPISGSCGGIAAEAGEDGSSCALCQKPVADCPDSSDRKMEAPAEI